MNKAYLAINILVTIIVSSLLFLGYAALQNSMHPLNELEPNRLGVCVYEGSVTEISQAVEQNGVISCPVGAFVPVIPGPPK